MISIMKFILFTLLLLSSSLISVAQKQPINYDESKVPSYTLPDPLKTLDRQWSPHREEPCLSQGDRCC